MAKTVETSVKAARKDTSKLSKAVRGDVADLQKAIVSPPSRKHVAAGKASAKKASAKRRTTAKSA